MKKITPILISLFITKLSFAIDVEHLTFSIDSSGYGITNQFNITVNLINKRGRIVAVRPNEFLLKWKKIKVQGEHILSVKDGIVSFNQQKINSNNNKIELTVSYQSFEGAPIIYQSKKLVLPFVRGLIIKNNSILVNSPTTLNYELIFNNGITAKPNEKLFNQQNIGSSSNSKIAWKNCQFQLNIQEPIPDDNVSLILKNKSTNELLGEKKLTIEYLTTCTINNSGLDGFNGQNGLSGRVASENGSNGTSGEHGSNALNLKILVRSSVINNSLYLTLHTFSSDGNYGSNIIKYNGTPIIIKANGGDGGNGGKGGDGMSGTVDTLRKINSPYGGNGGNGGHGGNAGNGGKITLIFDQATGDLSNYFEIEVREGTPGNPGQGGNAGSGDYKETGLIGTLLSVNRGSEGISGQRGNPGNSGIIFPTRIVSSEEWNSLYDKLIIERK